MKPYEEKTSSVHIYGPVPSRRLGFSLGVDIIPYKTCTLDCIYCQLGPTTRQILERKTYYPEKNILDQIKSTVELDGRIDYITFSGSGEPPLNSSLGPLIRKIKKMTSTPVAVLTNSTLFTQDSIRTDLLEADLVVPSLDAATQEVFERINRPYPSLKIQPIIDGLKKFQHIFMGEMWLEILLVRGVNNSPEHIRKLKETSDNIQPDKIHLNTVVRPPAEKFALPLTPKELEQTRKIFGEKAKIIAEFDGTHHQAALHHLKEAILCMIQRRPVTLSDMEASLGKHKNKIIKATEQLLKDNKIERIVHKGRTYYGLASS